MRIERSGAGEFILHANEEDLELINNALNEICNGLPLRDFQTRVGVPRAQAEAMLRLVNDTLNKYRRH